MGNPAIINNTFINEENESPYLKNDINYREKDSRIIGLVYDIADSMEENWEILFDIEEEDLEISSINLDYIRRNKDK